jgi:hypothetical protein
MAKYTFTLDGRRTIQPTLTVEKIFGLEKFGAEIKKQLKTVGLDIANRTAEKMRNHIVNNTDNSTGKLGENLRVDFQDNRDGSFSFKLGNLTELNKNAPYWFVLNAGAYIPPGNYGYWEGSKWIHVDKKDLGNYRDKDIIYMKPTKPITGIHYIEEGMKFLLGELRKKKWTKLFEKKYGKGR